MVTECSRLRVTRADLSIEEENSETWTPECLLGLVRVPAVEALLNRFYTSRGLVLMPRPLTQGRGDYGLHRIPAPTVKPVFHG